MEKTIVRKRSTSEGIRKKIRDIPYTEWKKMGFSKGALHYLKRNAEREKPATMNKHNKNRPLEFRLTDRG